MSAYDEGFNAFKKGMNVRENPFNRGDNEWQDWDEGWFDAQNSASSNNKEFAVDESTDGAE